MKRLPIFGRISHPTISLNPRHLVAASWLAFLLTAINSSVIAYDQAAAGRKLLLLLGGVLTALLLRRLAPLRTLWLLTLASTMIAVLTLIIFDWTLYPASISWLVDFGEWLAIERFSAESPHPNVASGAIATLLPFTTILLRQLSISKSERRICVLFALIQLFTLLLLGSRGAWIALPLAAAGAVALARVPLTSAKLFATVLIAFLLLALLVSLWPELALTVVNQLPDVGGSGRATLYQNTLILNGDYPLIGAGLATFPEHYASYSLLTHVEFLPHAHNLYLDIALEQGSLGLLCWLLLISTALWCLQTAPRKPLLIAAQWSLLTLLLHGLIDDPLYSSRMVVLLFVPLAFVPVSATVLRLRREYVAVGAAVIVLLLGWQRQTLLAAWRLNHAALAQSHAELTLYQWPDWVVQDAVRRELDLAPLIARYEGVLEIRPKSPSAHRRLGQIYLSTGNYEQALVHTQSAYDETPWHDGTRLQHGEALISSGQYDEGGTLWLTVSNQQGQLTLRHFWHQHINEATTATRMQSIIESQQ